MLAPHVTRSKDAILDRVRRANAHAAAAGLDARFGEWQSLPRDYRRTSSSTSEQLLNLFTERLKHYEADAYYVQPGAPSQADAHSHVLDGNAVPVRIAELLKARNKKRLVVAEGLSREYLPDAGFEFIPDGELSNDELGAADGVITTCTLAIALTGSIVLQSAPDQGRRRTTLLPDYHLCLLSKENILEFVPEAIARLAPVRNRPLTFFSGPSATVDIEMITVRGVHGPRTLDVLVF